MCHIMRAMSLRHCFNIDYEYHCMMMSINARCLAVYTVVVDE